MATALVAKPVIFGLPNLPGVSTLNYSEINNDLSELRKTISSNSDTDSESSIKSEDVLPSTYPVKPRSRNQIDKDTEADDLDGKELNNEEIQNALEFIRKLALTNKDLMDIEEQREEFEAVNKSYEIRTAEKFKAFQESKIEEENYLRFLQSISTRSLKLNTSLSQHLLVQKNLYEGLLTTKNELQKVSSSSLKNNANVFVVKYKTTQGRERSISLVKGERFTTSEGEYTIENIEKVTQTVIVQSPQGKEMMSLNQIIQLKLRSKEIPFSTVKFIDSWERNHKYALNIDQESKKILEDLFETKKNEEMDATDSDDDSEDDSMNEETLSQSDANNATEPSLSNPEETHLSEETSDATNEANSFKLNEVTSSSSSSSSNKTTSCVFPLKTTVPEPVARHVIKEELKKNAFENKKMLQNKFSLALAPTSAISTVIEHIKTPTLLADFQNKEEIEYEYSALNDYNDPNELLGRGAEFVWFGDVSKLQEELNQMYQEVASLETQHQHLISKVEHLRNQGNKYATEVSFLRMGMFSRRLAHRNNLGNHGIVPLLPINPTNVKQGFRSGVNLLSGLRDTFDVSSRNKARNGRGRQAPKEEVPDASPVLQSPTETSPTRRVNSRNRLNELAKLSAKEQENNKRNVETENESNLENDEEDRREDNDASTVGTSTTGKRKMKRRKF